MNGRESSRKEVNFDEIHIVKKKLHDDGVRYVFACYTNIYGTVLGKVIPLSEFLSIFTEGVFFAGVKADGLGQRANEEEVCGLGLVDDIKILPWNKEMAWIPVSLYKEGKPYANCPRNILRRTTEELFNFSGKKIKVGIEFEFYLVFSENNMVSPYLSEEPFIPAYNYNGTMMCSDFWSKLYKYLDELGIGVVTINHEGGKGQFEVSIKHTTPLESSDHYVLFKMSAQQAARELGFIATFMPKPFSDDLGNGLHINISIDNENVMGGVSESFIGGIANNIAGLMLVICPTVNSYKRIDSRLSDVSWITSVISCGINNRTSLIRIVPRDNRFEFRVPDASCNIYIALAATIYAGLDGVVKHSKLPSLDNRNLCDNLTHRKDDVKIPTNFIDSLNAFRNSMLMESFMGVYLKNDYALLKEGEYREYSANIEKWEYNRYLHV